MNPDKADDSRYFYQTTIDTKFFIDEFQTKLIDEVHFKCVDNRIDSKILPETVTDLVVLVCS